MVKIITPAEVENLKGEISRFPDFVIEAFNKAIQDAALKGNNRFTQNEVVDLIIEKSGKTVKREEIFNKHWLDVEKVYQKEGWDLRHYKHAYNETGEDYFYF